MLHACSTRFTSQFFSDTNYVIFTAQRLLVDAQDEAESDVIDNLLTVKTEIVTADDLSELQPSLEWSGNCGDPVTVTTFTHAQYDIDPVDADQLSAARSLKTKLTHARDVRQSLCLQELKATDCRRVNEVC